MSKKAKQDAAKRIAAGIKMPLHLKPGSVIVFEGLDGTGKTTQHERLERACYAPTTGTKMFDGEPMFLHMPSGRSDMGDRIYKLTESKKKINPVSRQLLHLACHAEELPGIAEGLLEGQSVFLDRFWWSTVAYGWKGARGTFTRRALADLAQTVWGSLPEPDLICLFMEPHVEDPHNNEDVIKGYEWLESRHSDGNVVRILPGNEAEQNMQIFQAMLDRGLYMNGVE